MPDQPNVRQSVLRFTIVIIVLGLLTVLLFPRMFGPNERVSSRVHDAAGIHVALREYKKEFGAFPVGDSRAMCRALQGSNPKKIVFIEFGARKVSPEGDLLDSWGTPYKIYYSGDEVLVRSAGKNRQFENSTASHYDDFIY